MKEAVTTWPEGSNMKAHKRYFLLSRSRIADDKGQTLAEYALLLLLIAVVVAATIPGVTNALANSYASIAATLPP